MVSSSWYSSASKLYVFNLLYRNLTAAYLCCVVIRRVWYYGVSKRRFSVDGCFPAGGSFLNGCVKIVYCVVFF
jgi:hypothetical protein